MDGTDVPSRIIGERVRARFVAGVEKRWWRRKVIWGSGTGVVRATFMRDQVFWAGVELDARDARVVETELENVQVLRDAGA